MREQTLAGNVPYVGAKSTRCGVAAGLVYMGEMGLLWTDFYSGKIARSIAAV